MATKVSSQENLPKEGNKKEMTEFPEIKRSPTGWKVLHANSFVNGRYCWISFVYVLKKGFDKNEVLKRLTEDFENSTRKEEHDEEVFREVDKDFKKIRQVRIFNQVTIEEYFVCDIFA